jgi:hypothetical protein
MNRVIIGAPIHNTTTLEMVPFNGSGYLYVMVKYTRLLANRGTGVAVVIGQLLLQGIRELKFENN